MTTTREDLIYEQNSIEFRSLNGFFWQIPLIMMTLNGGLWYSVASLDLDVTSERGMLGFAALANLTMAVGLWRLRAVMGTLLANIHAYQGTTAPGPSKLIERLFQLLMVVAALGALAASWNPKAHFVRPPTDACETCHPHIFAAAASDPSRLKADAKAPTAGKK